MGRNFACGDMHKLEKDTRKINSFYFPEQEVLTKEDVVFQLGDFGWLWSRPGVNPLCDYYLDYLGSRNFTLAVVPGNHENYELINFLPTQQKWGNTVSVLNTENGTIYFLKRGGIYTINGQTILAIGGAESIDKGQRVPYVSWWPEERLSHKEINECLIEVEKNTGKVDVILSHTCPSVKAHLFRKELSCLGEQCSVSRFLDHIDNFVSFNTWHFAHLHVDKSIMHGRYTCHINNPPTEITQSKLPLKLPDFDPRFIGESYLGLKVYLISNNHPCVRLSDIRNTYLSEKWGHLRYGSTVMHDKDLGIMVYLHDWENFFLSHIGHISWIYQD